LKILRRRGVKSPKNQGVLVEEAPNYLGRAQPSHTLEMGWKKEARVQRGTGSPLYSWETQRPKYVRARSWTCPANRICPGQRSDMSDENCIGIFGNLVNRPKTQYPTDFDVGPIEYIYIYIYMCVCGTWTSYENKKKYGLKPLES
jgi:hypothetical protein